MILKLSNKIFGFAVFIISLSVFLTTMQPTVSFWDCGEFTASAYLMQVPHPPGTPFFLILGRVFSMIPFADNIGFRVNMVSVLASALSVLFLYLVAVKVILNLKKETPKTLYDALLIYIPASIGALSLAFSDTFWFNAVESEVYATSTFFIAFVIWLMTVWNEKADEPDNEKYIIFIFYLIGISTGVHLMSALAIVPVVMTIYFRKYVTDEKILEKTGLIFVIHSIIILVIAAIMWSAQTESTVPTPEKYSEVDSRFLMILVVTSLIFMGVLYKKIIQRNSFYIPIIYGGISLIVIYPGLVKYLPKSITVLGNNDFSTSIFVAAAILSLTVFAIYRTHKNGKSTLNLAFKCLFFAIIGSSSVAMIIIRANQETPINLNSPKTFTELDSYINREQYGDFPTFQRRFSSESHQINIYTDYSSDLDFLWRYQMNHMFNRYLFWNYIGRESTYQDSGIDWKDLYGIPFLIGLFGIYFLFRKDWKTASTYIVMFIFLGYLTAFYQNQQEPQPRERDYFYVGAFFVFSFWIALGMNGIIEILSEKFRNKKLLKPLIALTLLLGIILIPINMLKANWFEHNRTRNYVPWDYAYNLLQSVAPNAVLFTNGDNDTFPLWYLQNVEGVRRDVRIANLSLLNTNWYIKQLKNTTPFGAPKVDISFSDEQIDQLAPERWDPTELFIDVPPDVIKEWNVKDSAIVKDGKLKWTMKPPTKFGEVGVVRVQDIVTLDIIMQSKWKRPVYIAVTCAEDSKLSLDDYLAMEGMALRLVPKKNEIPQIDFINEPILRKQLFDEPSLPSLTYKPGFKFRGLNDKSIFFDENHERLVQNYRNSFIRLALHYYYKEKNKDKTVSALVEMEKKMPRSVIAMDYRIKHDVAKILFNAGAFNLYETYAKEVILGAKEQLEKNPRDYSSWYNPYDILLTHYDNLQMYKEAVGTLVQLQNFIPNDDGVKNLLNEFRKKAGMSVPEILPKQLDNK